jgi:hypothetical protein
VKSPFRNPPLDRFSADLGMELGRRSRSARLEVET